MSSSPSVSVDPAWILKQVGPAWLLATAEGRVLAASDGLRALLGGRAASGAGLAGIAGKGGETTGAMLLAWARIVAETRASVDGMAVPVRFPSGQGLWEARVVPVPGDGDPRVAIGFQPLSEDARTPSLPESGPGRTGDQSPPAGPDQERLAAVLRAVGEGVVITGPDRCVTYLSREAERLTGWLQAEAVGQPVGRVVSMVDEAGKSPEKDPLDGVFVGGLPVGWNLGARLRSRGGRETHIAWSAQPVRAAGGGVLGAVVLLRDDAERHRAEQEMMRLQQLESIALLVGGIGHDFNNILTGVLGNLSLARSCVASTDPVYAIIKTAERATFRAKDLTRQLQGFVHGTSQSRRILLLGDLLKESGQFILRGSACRLQLRIDPNLLPIEADEGQLSQVFNNLLMNAVQAMPSGGTVEILADNVELDGTHPEPLPPGRFVRVQVADHGSGISPEHLSRIFEPYFTTKRRGTGLGLATSHAILRAHQGSISVRSTVGKGTTFTLLLPARDASALAPGKAASKSSVELHDGPLPTGGGRILVMDDEPIIQEIFRDMLSVLGYSPEFAADGLEAVRLYREALGSDQPYQLVLLDLTVPGGHGARETLAALRALNPHLLAVVTTGYGNDPAVLQPESHGFRAALLKPFTLHQLGTTLAEVLRG